VASFFVSRVDTEVDRRLAALGTEDALALRGRVAVAQARLAFQLFREAHTGPRWERLADRGARVQHPLWASLRAFEDHGTLARMIDVGVSGAREVMHRLARLVDMEDVGGTLERDGVAAFQASFDHVLGSLRVILHRPAACW
jgi:transaldolase